MNYKYLLIVFAILIGCSKPVSDVESKKKDLEAAKLEKVSLEAKIASLEKEIHAADPTFLANRNAVLIAAQPVTKKGFEHFVDMRGSVQSRKNVSLSTQVGGTIQRVYVKEGQRVTKGQALVVLDAEILRSSLSELKTQIELATITFEKQERLWNQKIGSEMQYLQAKNQKESLEKRLAVTQAQLDQLTLKAPFTGTIDMVDALEGEMASPGKPLVRMVNADEMYVNADVSEEFIGKFKAGDPAEIFIPALDKKVRTTISAVGQVINPENRTFVVELSLPAGLTVKPNQVTIVKLRDYVNAEVYAVPTRIIQRDKSGHFVFAVENKGNVSVARKIYIKAGASYNSVTEILEGLTGSEVVIFEGFREVTEGAEVNIAAKTGQDVAQKQ
ncbi:MAG: efflux RND transporter periplasmic adaptor subunit [Cyclobacteriaceae bacterium]|nr:efflux RND transporter periplasmic adaptor subunit [Cyclobacteriaceae bacterium]